MPSMIHASGKPMCQAPPRDPSWPSGRSRIPHRNISKTRCLRSSRPSRPVLSTADWCRSSRGRVKPNWRARSGQYRSAWLRLNACSIAPCSRPVLLRLRGRPHRLPLVQGVQRAEGAVGGGGQDRVAALVQARRADQGRGAEHRARRRADGDEDLRGGEEGEGYWRRELGAQWAFRSGGTGGWTGCVKHMLEAREIILGRRVSAGHATALSSSGVVAVFGEL